MIYNYREYYKNSKNQCAKSVAILPLTVNLPRDHLSFQMEVSKSLKRNGLALLNLCLHQMNSPQTMKKNMSNKSKQKPEKRKMPKRKKPVHWYILIEVLIRLLTKACQI